MQHKAKLGAEHPQMIAQYTALNKPDEAKKWQAERAKYPQGKNETPQK